ncbi:type VI secretion system-associated FHA domain protein TagH [Paracidovorax cattleyae]|uniref:FHA domain protein n=1 Tax=Paracidovorax cattleyae TaxID=80868 RepID=A0A1H0W426_9BURK|nr:type VI secretion system-associated FHA domain protein TagH [Paracidovorax cattleyae]AVS73771.1 type VI secretion system-associated FHA domain protein TagH [Paracidovorax cattleyae]SDP85487.1 FHA domain protein [Paracidovorax cattleyae]
MDKVELRVIRHADEAVDRLWTAVFGVAGGTIGRGGQNKLVLSDSDAGVARVHAMVRIESEAAFIANLCERRSIFVAGAEVRSGEEVRLSVGDEVRIGPYVLHSVVPGSPFVAAAVPVPAVAPGSAQVPAPVPAPLVISSPPASEASGAFPVHVPSVAGAQGDGIPAALSLTAAVPVPAGIGLPAEAAAPTEDDDNPFAMLGRVEGPAIAAAPASPVTAPVAGPAAVSASEPAPGPVFAPVPPAPQPQPLAAPLGTQGGVLGFAAAPTPVPPAPVSAPVPAGQGVPGNAWAPAAQDSKPAAAAPRALVIPEDFDLFAADPRKGEEKKDAWGGGLQAKSLSEIANMRHDELLQSLPASGSKFAHDMDNPAHAGLPKALDPRDELDPLRLFAGEADAAASLVPERSAMALGSGSDLSQSFSLPRGVQAPAGQELPGARELAPRAASAVQGDGAAPGMVSPALPVPALDGLQRVEGLDLGAFGSASADPLGWPSVESGPAPVFAATDVPLQPAAAGMAAVGAKAVPIEEVALAHVSAAAGVVPVPVPTPSPIPAPVAVPAPAAIPGSAGQEGAARSPLAPVLPELAAASPAELQSLIAAFLDGAGVLQKKVEAQKLSPEFMRSFGEAFRVAVQGTIDLLAARSEIKREFRAGVTVISSGANNPLKFLPTPEGVVMQMIGQNFPGFMKPIPAMQEAYDDLRVHQVALMAGLRAAYAEALERFDPAALEQRTDVTGGVFGKLSATSRKAALWDEYKRNFAEIRRGAEDDLAAFSGQAFLEAYENAEAAAKART